MRARETAWCFLYFNLARLLLDTNIIQFGIVSRRPSEGRQEGSLNLYRRGIQTLLLRSLYSDSVVRRTR